MRGEVPKRYVSLAYTHAPTDPRVRRHCETLARRGWRVYQLGLGAPEEARAGRLNGVCLIRRPRQRYRGRNLMRYLWSYIAFLVWARRLLARLGEDGGLDVVQVNNIPNFLVWATRGARRRGARVVLDIHDPEPELFLSKFGGSGIGPWGSRLLAWTESLASRAANQVICVNEQHRVATVGHGVDAGKVQVVPNYADAQLFPVRAPRVAGPFVAYHGTVAARMGLDVVLRGLAAARTEHAGLRGAIWGDGDAVASLTALRGALNLTNVVDLPGKRFRLEDLVPRLDAVGLGVVPLRRDGFTDLALPTKLLEYVRLGIPVIVTWTPTIGHYFPDDTVLFIRDFTPGGVARAIGTALADPEAARERARRAQGLPIAGSWQQNEQAYVDVLLGR